MYRPSLAAPEWVKGMGASAIQAHLLVEGSYTSDLGVARSGFCRLYPPNTYIFPPTTSARASANHWRLGAADVHVRVVEGGVVWIGTTLRASKFPTEPSGA